MQNNANSDYDHSESLATRPLSLSECQSPNPPQQQTEPSGGFLGPRSLDDNAVLGLNSPIDDLKKTAQFIHSLQGATLEHSNMRQDDIEQLHATDPDPCLNIAGDKHFIKLLRGFISTTSAPQATYNDWRDLLLDCYPDDPFLSFDQMKRCVEQLSGVVPIYHDMCQCYTSALSLLHAFDP